MKYGLTITVIALLLITTLNAETPPPQYKSYEIREVFKRLITRSSDDQVHSGQIGTKEGLAEFEKVYSVALGLKEVDFSKQMLIFGNTDSITTRATTLKQHKVMRTFFLEYAMTGIRYKLRGTPEGKKYSYLQVFIIDKIENISPIGVRNFVPGLSRIYGK